MEPSQVGERIMRLRKEKGWTQKELAKEIHVTDKAVSKWERGINYPDLSVIETLASVLEVSTSELLGLENSNIQDALDTTMQMAELDRKRILKDINLRAIIIGFYGFIVCMAGFYQIRKSTPTDYDSISV